MSNLCSSCSSIMDANAKFCAHCGKANQAENLSAEAIFLEGHARRFKYGSAESLLSAGESIWVDSSSEEFKNANSPFSPTKIPQEGDLVPGDCVWSSFKYPGPISPEILGRSFEENVTDDLWMTGRPLEEINLVLGPPIVPPTDSHGMGLRGGGLFLLLYRHSFGFMKRQVKVAGVWFDNYRVALQAEENVAKYMPRT